jgi:hypothetical protein
MRYAHNFHRVLPIMSCCVALTTAAVAFEGRINVVVIQGNQTNALLYTVGTDSLRVEMTATNWPNPVDVLDRNSGTLTLLFPNNRSFVHLKSATDAATVGAPGMPGIPAPIGAGPDRPPIPPGVGPQAQSGMSSMPPMPMPMMPGMMDKMELQATGQKTNLLGLACQQYQLKYRGETLEIWATDQLFPYQPYVQNQPHRFGPRRIEEQWPAMLTSRKLFPLLARLRYDNGVERFRFEVQSVTPQKITDDEAKLFQPPDGWFEIQPLPF